MGWRGIPILAALGVIGVTRILYDPMPASAPAAAINTNLDDATDLSRVDFSALLGPTTAPTTAPTTMPLSDGNNDGTDSVDSTATTTTGLPTYFRKYLIEKIQWVSTATQSTAGSLSVPDPFAQPAIDSDAKLSDSLVDFATDFDGEASSAGRGKSSAATPLAPLSDEIASANEPADSIVGYDFAGNTPLPRPTTSLPPISVPEPQMLVLPLFTMWMSCTRRV